MPLLSRQDRVLSKVNVPKTSLQLVAMCCLEVAGECPAGLPFLTRSFSRWFSGRLFGPKGSRALAAPPTMSIRDRADEAARVGRSTRDLPIARGALPRSIDIVGLAARLRAASPPPQFQKSHPLVKVLNSFHSQTHPLPHLRLQSNTRRSSRMFRPSPSCASAPATCTAARSSRKWSSQVRPQSPRQPHPSGP